MSCKAEQVTTEATSRRNPSQPGHVTASRGDRVSLRPQSRRARHSAALRAQQTLGCYQRLTSLMPTSEDSREREMLQGKESKRHVRGRGTRQSSETTAMRPLPPPSAWDPGGASPGHPYRDHCTVTRAAGTATLAIGEKK